MWVLPYTGKVAHTEGEAMKIAEIYGERLQAFRKEAGLSQSGLAAQSGVPIGTIQDYEHGRYGPSLEIAFKLARTLGKPLEAFLPSEGEDAGPVKAKGRKRKHKPSAEA